MTKLDLTLPASGPGVSPEAITDIAEGAECIGLASVWTFERLMRPIHGDTPIDGATTCHCLRATTASPRCGRCGEQTRSHITAAFTGSRVANRRKAGRTGWGCLTGRGDDAVAELRHSI